MRTPTWVRSLTAAMHQARAVKGEPPITIRARFSSQVSGGNAHPTRVVIHATAPNIGWPRASEAGKALSTARYFAGPKAGGSAHYIVDVAGEQHCVPESTVAYHAPPNAHSIGIEICAEATYSREQWLSPQVWPAVLRAAARTADLCSRYGIPAVRLGPAALKAGGKGVCGHWDISQAFKQSSHTDPGPAFPWAEFMAAVGGAPVAPPVAPASAAELPSLAYGDTGTVVESLQGFCNAYPWRPELETLRIDGRYGPATARVIAAAQRQMAIFGSDADGRHVGPRTKAGLWSRGWRG
jgi:N-acetyl-anhydromuramyl-L-alanine amidase AmpD